MRSRLNERLERAARYPVTLIVAPAGFGKTSALRDFMQNSRLDAVRYDVRREDNTLLAFVHRLSEALAPVAPSALAAFPSIQERVLATAEPVRQLSEWFAEHLKFTACTIVIDDLHYAAADPASIALLADLAERSAPRIKWIIAARSDVGLPVGSWIAYGLMDLPLGEEDLRFTTDEALAAADANAAGLDPQEVEALRQLTEGWPVALTIAIRTRTHSRDLRTASFGTREMIYRYLAEQVYAGLSEEQRAFALASSVFSSFDTAIAQEMGATTAFIQDLRSKIAFLNEPAPGKYRYHDLFRDFLETELRRGGEREFAQSLCRSAGILERREEFAGALALYSKAQSGTDILRIVDSQGFALFERGEREALASALEAIAPGTRQDARILGIRAMIEASRGRFEAAEHDFLSAIELSGEDNDLRLRLVYRYAIESVRRGRDCSALLEPYARDDSLPRNLRIPLLGTLSTAYAANGRTAEGATAIAQALQLCDASINDDARARLYQQASYALYAAGDYEQARRYAQSAAELATALDLYEVAARAYLNLFVVVYEEEDDPLKWLSILDRVAESARKGASNQAKIFALVEAYPIEVERGNDSEIERLAALLDETRALYPQGYSRALKPADAMREASGGNFGRAYEALAGDAPAGDTSERRALRSAMTSLYALAAGLSAEGDAAFTEAAAALAHAKDESRRTIQARVFLALADLVRGHSAGAHRHLNEAERAGERSSRRMRALVGAARAVYRVRMGHEDEAARSAALERLRAEHYGGMARLIAALPLEEESGSAYGALTSAEREILQLLATGASTKDVAGRTGRSPHTVDTHIRSICRKLHCSGRREAVALATSQGWVQT